MVRLGLRVLGVLAFVVPLSCGPDVEPAADGAAGSSGGTSGGGSAGLAGSGGSVSSGGTGGKGGLGGTASGGRAGGSATGGSDSVGGSSGHAGGEAIGGTGGTGGSGTAGAAGDSGDAGATNGDSISWNDEGVISSDTNDFGIQGTWFIENDCEDANPAGIPCTVPDPTMVGPDMRPGWTTSADRVCAKGLASQVTTDPMTGMPAYELQWGVRLGFELNATTTGTRGAYDTVMHGIRGFVFDVTTPTVGAPPTLRVNFVTTSTTEDTAHFVEVSLPAVQQTIWLDDAFQGDWITAPGPLDKTALTAVTFWVFTNSASPKPFDFCISNARVVL